MWVLRATVNLESLEHAAAEFVFRKHPLHGHLDDPFGEPFLHSLVGNLFKGSRVLAVSLVYFLLGLCAGDLDLAGVDYDDEVAGEHMGHVVGLVFAHQQHRHLGCESSEYLVAGVQYLPVVHHLFGARVEVF